ncbi:MAG: response regulator [Lachnospiraceae bacterium]|nr:response regulator [Lachnospiraceae bacterium]
MKKGKKGNRNSIQNLIVAFLLAVGVLSSFILFYHSNVTRITRQNENYIADVAIQKAVLIGDLFDENLAYIESSAIVLETAFYNSGVDVSRLNVTEEEQIDESEAEKVAQILREYEERLVFDHLRFIDLYGRDYTTGTKIIAANVSERGYFKEGILGKTGITYILNSKVTSERQIGFYSPVYQNGEIAGLAVGFYGESFIDELIDISMFDHECDVLLCSRDGVIIYSVGNDYGASNFLEELSLFPFTEEKDRQNVTEAFSKKENTIYSYKEAGKKSVGTVSYIGNSSDFFMILNFPPEAYESMLRNSNMNGAVLLLCLIGFFLAAGIFYIVRFLIQKKQLLEETKNSNDIHFAMSRLFENFVIINARTRTYHYIEGMPEVGHIPNDGSYDLFTEDLLKRFPNEAERKEAAELISFPSLIEQMNQGKNIISYNLHAPIREEEWFTYNFIVVSRDEDGNVSEFIIARQDISKLQEKEENTKRILEKARDEAEKGNRAKSDFLSSMSHDIRTPMNAIIGYTNIAIGHMNDHQLVRDSLGKISSSSHYLLSLINDVLDMSKIESGKIQLNETECDLGQVFERLADMTRSQANRKKLEVTYEAGGIRHPHVLADEVRLEQILINITGNAVKYTPEGGSIRITAEETEEYPDSRSLYRFTVRDTGIGMSEDFLPHIFESFSRETNSTINKIQGTGLGMAITFRLVKLMGGEISVSSRPGEGSEFTVSIPLVRTERKKEETPDYQEEETEGIDLTGKRVLLVEDNDINAEIASMVLSEYGVITERAVNGQEGINRIRETEEGYFDAVLMDIQMPVMNGYEATKQIRHLGGEYVKKLPIIAMSANAYEEDIREALSSGMNGHIAKPFDPVRLAAELQKRICESAGA